VRGQEVVSNNTTKEVCYERKTRQLKVSVHYKVGADTIKAGQFKIKIKVNLELV
jgi:hypothetical protein